MTSHPYPTQKKKLSLTKKIGVFGLCAFIALSISGCDRPYLDEESSLMQRTTMEKAQLSNKADAALALKSGYASMLFHENNVSDAALNSLLNAYKENGHGPIFLVLAYNNIDATDKISAYEQMTASRTLKNRIKALGGDNTEIITSLVPLSDIQPAQESAKEIGILGFHTEEVTAGPACENQSMPGADTATKVTLDGYKVGCRLTTLTARQIANKEDLLGRSGIGGQNNAERAGNVMDNVYRPGEAQEYLPGFVISELGGSGD
jgi:type IV pilus biogenesis protein CpaD/CtpE